jgi:hypothetical protein
MSSLHSYRHRLNRRAVPAGPRQVWAALPVSDAALLEAAFLSLDSILDQFSRRIEPPHDTRSELAMTDLALRWSEGLTIAEADADARTGTMPTTGHEPHEPHDRRRHDGQGGAVSPADASNQRDPVDAEGDRDAEIPGCSSTNSMPTSARFFEETDHLFRR